MILFSAMSDLAKRESARKPSTAIDASSTRFLLLSTANLAGCTRPKGGPRSRPSGCYERFCCRRSTASARSAS